MTCTSSQQLQAFLDADWAGCPDDQKLTGAYCVFLGANLISWSSRKQPTVSRSSTEVKYKSVANTAVELLWLQALLRDLGISKIPSPKLWCDNIGATCLSVNPVFHARTKHVEIDFHFVRDRVADKSLHVLFIPSKDQLVDVLTKPIVVTRFQDFCYKLNVCCPPLNLKEGVKAQVILKSNTLCDSIEDQDKDQTLKRR